MSKTTKTKQSDILDKLGIESEQDLRQFVLCEYLELIQSEKIEIKMQALKEVSKYLFNVTGMCKPLGNDLKDEDRFNFN
jgi:hypothetical protein